MYLKSFTASNISQENIKYTHFFFLTKLYVEEFFGLKTIDHHLECEEPPQIIYFLDENKMSSP